MRRTKVSAMLRLVFIDRERTSTRGHEWHLTWPFNISIITKVFNLKCYWCSYRHLSNLTLDFSAIAAISLQRQAHWRAIQDCAWTKREFPNLGCINKLTVHINPSPANRKQPNTSRQRESTVMPSRRVRQCPGAGEKRIEERARDIFPDKNAAAAALLSNETSQNLSLWLP